MMIALQSLLVLLCSFRVAFAINESCDFNPFSKVSVQSKNHVYSISATSATVHDIFTKLGCGTQLQVSTSGIKNGTYHSFSLESDNIENLIKMLASELNVGYCQSNNYVWFAPQKEVAERVLRKNYPCDNQSHTYCFKNTVASKAYDLLKSHDATLQIDKERNCLLSSASEQKWKLLHKEILSIDQSTYQYKLTLYILSDLKQDVNSVIINKPDNLLSFLKIRSLMSLLCTLRKVYLIMLI